jgi:hypothetical protein
VLGPVVVGALRVARGLPATVCQVVSARSMFGELTSGRPSRSSARLVDIGTPGIAVVGAWRAAARIRDGRLRGTAPSSRDHLAIMSPRSGIHPRRPLARRPGRLLRPPRSRTRPRAGRSASAPDAEPFATNSAVAICAASSTRRRRCFSGPDASSRSLARRSSEQRTPAMTSPGERLQLLTTAGPSGLRARARVRPACR